MLAETHPVCVENFHIMNIMNIEVPARVGGPSHPTPPPLDTKQLKFLAGLKKPHYMVESANQMVLCGSSTIKYIYP